MNYQRNRLRHQVLPVIKSENEQSFAHFQQLSEQIQELDGWLSQQQKNWFAQNVQTGFEELTIDLDWYARVSPFERKYFLKEVVRFAQVTWQLVISKKQLDKMMTLLDQQGKPQWQIDLVEGWHFSRRYGELHLKKNQTKSIKQQARTIALGQSFF
ncbi:hypothetical protein ACFQOY_07300 [Enterococcus alcedinis]|uniref:hypothetical protein n=1 Tax=Enterococcus alcedinis TaxID=1274384 RepID=UPI003615C15E